MDIKANSFVPSRSNRKVKKVELDFSTEVTCNPKLSINTSVFAQALSRNSNVIQQRLDEGWTHDAIAGETPPPHWS